MSSFENRLEKLEQRSGMTRTKTRPRIVVVWDIDPESREAALEAAKAEYKVMHPDWQGRNFNVIWTATEEGKELTERIMQGEGTGAGTKSERGSCA